MVHALPPAVSILRVVTFAKGRAATSISLALALGHEKKIPIFPFGNFVFSIFEIFGCGLSSVVVMVCSNFFCVFGNLEGAQQRRSQKTRERRNLRTRHRGRSKPGHGRGEYNTDRERGYRGGRTPLWRSRRRGVVWCGPREPALPTFLCASDLLFFSSSSSQRGGGGGSGFASAEKGGAGGRVERLPAVSGHGTPALEPRRTGPPRTKNHRTPLVGHACTPARANARYPPTPAPPPFAADEWTYAFSCMFYLY